jgi:hypothetical protein
MDTKHFKCLAQPTHLMNNSSNNAVIGMNVDWVKFQIKRHVIEIRFAISRYNGYILVSVIYFWYAMKTWSFSDIAYTMHVMYNSKSNLSFR